MAQSTSDGNVNGAVYPAVHYMNADAGIKSWFLTLDHKRIALMYLVLTSLAFLVGGLFAMALRIEHLTPDKTIMGANTYNRMFTLHGVVMIFLFIIPAVPGVVRELPAAADAGAPRTWPSRA